MVSWPSGGRASREVRRSDRRRPALAIALHCQGARSIEVTEASRSFNADFYVASVTVIPIFFIISRWRFVLPAIPSCAGWSLYRYRKLRRFESMRERFHWLIRGMLVALTALLVPVVALGWGAEVIALLALDKRTIGQSQHSLVLIGVVALPTVLFLWAIAIREREPTPLDEELDQLSRNRRETINGMSERLHSMERAASRDDASDTAKVRRTRRQLGALDSSGSEADEFDWQGASVASNSSRASAAGRATVILVAWGTKPFRALCPLPRSAARLLRWVSSPRLVRATALLLAQRRRLETTLMTRARITPPNK